MGRTGSLPRTAAVALQKAGDPAHGRAAPPKFTFPPNTQGTLSEHRNSRHMLSCGSDQKAHLGRETPNYSRCALAQSSLSTTVPKEQRAAGGQDYKSQGSSGNLVLPQFSADSSRLRGASSDPVPARCHVGNHLEDPCFCKPLKRAQPCAAFAVDGASQRAPRAAG